LSTTQEDNLGAPLCGFGRHEWDDGTVGAAIWDGYYQVIMWSLGALVSAGFLLGGGSFASALAGVLGSLVANQIAAFVIQWVLQMTTEFIIWNIIVSIPVAGGEEIPGGQESSSNTRYRSWARQ
jgi:hypothetical protein